MRRISLLAALVVLGLALVAGRGSAAGQGQVKVVEAGATFPDRAYILRNGKIFRKGRPDELSNDPEVRRVYLGDHFRLN